MSLRPSPENLFLTAAPGRIFAATALPMIVIMVMNGMLSVIDAVFLERFVGAQAMAAVGMAFPALMLTIALSTLVSCGNWFAVDGYGPSIIQAKNIPGPSSILTAQKTNSSLSPQREENAMKTSYSASELTLALMLLAGTTLSTRRAPKTERRLVRGHL